MIVFANAYSSESFALYFHAPSRFWNFWVALDWCERQIVDTPWNDPFMYFIHFRRTDISLAAILLGGENVTLVPSALEAFLSLVL